MEKKDWVTLALVYIVHLRPEDFNEVRLEGEIRCCRRRRTAGDRQQQKNRHKPELTTCSSFISYPIFF